MGGIHVDKRSAAVGLTRGRARRRPGAGFTLIELMVVILIIGVVVAIVFPALTGARNAARKASTQAMMTELATASQQFYADNSRQPGYFTPLEMGSAENLTRGLTTLENIMLDLAGGITDATGTDIIEVGPQTTNTVNVDLRLIGAASEEAKRYWLPDKRNFVAQMGNEKQFAVAAHHALPDVVDAWGTPILAWTQDEPGAAENVRFAQESYSPGANAPRAHFYWAANAGFLKATSLGKLNRNMTDSTPEAGFSLIGDRMQLDKAVGSMYGLLGNPAYPDPDPPSGLPGNNMYSPKVGRAAIVYHSAGGDGYFLGSNEVGGKQAGANRVLKYNPVSAAATPGAPIQRQPDPMDGFDDLLVNHGSTN